MSLFTKKQLEMMPDLNSQGVGKEFLQVYLVVVLGGFCWLLTEYDKRNEIFLCFACLNDPDMAELGYISKAELDHLELKFKFHLDVYEENMSLKEAKRKYIGI
jgi:hypothetical protein